MRPVARLLAITALLAAPLAAQAKDAPIPLSKVITTFLVDSGVRVRGLPWTVADPLPITWSTPRPVAATGDWYQKQGITQLREGTLRVTAGDSVVLPMGITLYAGANGLTSVAVSSTSLQVTNPDGSGYLATREMIEEALRHDGLMLQPIKCSRDSEGASYGNLVDAVKAPGKTASGLWWSWDAPMQELRVTLTLLYRRADMQQVECAGS
ncbi:MAG: hypothetical protein KC489_03585 [Gemmatimonadetes bacterium]|nr:hypothetical protein [Gemmatimonadota bacterium]